MYISVALLAHAILTPRYGTTPSRLRSCDGHYSCFSITIRCGAIVTYINDAVLAQSYLAGLLDRHLAPGAPDMDSSVTPVVVPSAVARRIPAVAEELSPQRVMSELAGLPCNKGSMAYRAASKCYPGVANSIRKAVRRSGQKKHDSNHVAKQEHIPGDINFLGAWERLVCKVRTATRFNVHRDREWHSAKNSIADAPSDGWEPLVSPPCAG